MSRTITVSDDVFRKLERERERGDRSFDAVLRDLLEEQRTLADVAGTGILDHETHDGVKDDIERLSQGMLSRLDES